MGYLHINDIIFNKKHPFSWQIHILWVAVLLWIIIFNQMIYLKWNRNRKRASYIFFAFQFYRSTHPFNNIFDNRKSQTGATECCSWLFAFLRKSIKRMFLKFFTHTKTGIWTYKLKNSYIPIIR